MRVRDSIEKLGLEWASRAQTQRRKVVEVFHLHQASYGCHAKGLAHGQEMRWVEMAKVSRHEHGDAWMWKTRGRSVQHVSIHVIWKSSQAILRTSDRSSATSRELGGQGEVGRVSATLSERDFKLLAADKFHLLMGGLYAGLDVGVARLRRGIFELCG